MINIDNKQNCCGCGACAQKCPHQCIHLKTDNEGFLYPIVDMNLCINCHVCEKVCPIIQNNSKRNPIKVYASKHQNEKIKKDSSSGGIFTYIAENIISQGGVVFGACFDDEWQVKLDYTETKEGLAIFRGSKYVQATVGNSYKHAEAFLKKNRIVLFTGTPCQIGGLKSYLRKEYDNLITLDFLCHGVPSPKVWNNYLNELLISEARNNSVPFSSIFELKSHVKKISFRDKSLGWRKFSFSLYHDLIKQTYNSNSNITKHSQYHQNNTYMKGFLGDLYLRPSCHSCCFKRFQSKSDITIADYWGISRIHPNFEDYNGVSMVFINTLKTIDYFPSSKLTTIETTFEDTLSNKGLHENVPMHKNRNYFFKKMDNTTSIINLIEKCVKQSLTDKIINKIKNIIK